MHKPINLITLLRGIRLCPQDKRASFFVAYEVLLSKRESELKYRHDEVASLMSFARGCINRGVPSSCLDGFAYSYPIPHVPKEMDLLKVGEKCVLNIELKSFAVSEEKAKKQLARNSYYLSFLSEHVSCLCYTAADGSWLRLIDGEVFL